MLRLFYISSKDVSDEMPDDISEYRKEKIISARRDGAKRLMIAAALVLKAGFASFGISEKDVVYKTLENGKPYALSHPEIHFSLSHSENMAVAVFSDSPVGVDCEKADREVPAELVRRFLRLEKVAKIKEPLLAWVAGESISKLSGMGIFGETRCFFVPQFDGKTATVGNVVLTRLILNGNVTVVATEKRENIEVFPIL